MLGKRATAASNKELKLTKPCTIVGRCDEFAITAAPGDHAAPEFCTTGVADARQNAGHVLRFDSSGLIIQHLAIARLACTRPEELDWQTIEL